MISRFVPIAALAILAGCQSVSDAMKYEGTPVMRFEYDGDNWRIFDKPAEGKMMTTPSIGKGASAGAASGLTLGIAQTLPEGLQHQEMAKAYIASTGRTCTITDTRKVIYGQYEHVYSCEN
ncbi:hypothetical protein B0E33_01360 [Roseibium algicola]|uniref:Lipoprotein n=1 Tax=Roseibium algicola TaxID=2857014 RepID=A0ABM6HWI0_9HYPH|nr:hypothetical protein [Roseibium aggregatum]AQQ02403.1 hypothetical protein B0E33_01360 [Roseibium aggregatum]